MIPTKYLIKRKIIPTCGAGDKNISAEFIQISSLYLVLKVKPNCISTNRSMVIGSHKRVQLEPKKKKRNFATSSRT